MTRTSIFAAVPLLSLLAGTTAFAGPDAGVAPAPTARDDQQVLTFWGLLELEKDPNVPDDQKIREWTAFIERAKGQIDYADKAIQRWKDQPRVRALEEAQRADGAEDLAPSAKIERWRELARLFPKSAEAKHAEKRIAFWSAEEAQKRSEAAKTVERSGANKIERIKAWGAVIEWSPVGAEARAAQARVQALQAQLFLEAQSLDKLLKVHPESKIELWKDVLAGRPTPDQKALAEKRIAALGG